ncbi:molybdenum cofactor biosynthesis protein, partial [Staphylococcus aureus]
MDEHQNVKLNRTVKAAVLTVSVTRYLDTDKGVQCVLQSLQEDDVEVSHAHYTIVKDKKVAI